MHYARFAGVAFRAVCLRSSAVSAGYAAGPLDSYRRRRKGWGRGLAVSVREPDALSCPSTPASSTFRESPSECNIQGLFERKARVPQPPGLSGKSRVVRRTGVVGCPSLWFLSFWASKRELLAAGLPPALHIAHTSGSGLSLTHTDYQIDAPVRRVSPEHALPGVARQLVTFSCVAKKR